MSREIAQHTDGSSGRIVVIGYWGVPILDDDKEQRRLTGIEQQRAVDNAKVTADAIVQWLPKFKGRVSHVDRHKGTTPPVTPAGAAVVG